MARIIGYAPAPTSTFPSAVKYYVTNPRDGVEGLQCMEVWCRSAVMLNDKVASLGDEVDVRFSFKFKHFYIISGGK